jgi:hypothetical protein
MLANITCWVIALGLMFSESVDRRDLYIKSALAIGFIFVGVLSKSADYYREIHIKK